MEEILMIIDGDENNPLEVFDLNWGTIQSASHGGGGGMPGHTPVTIKTSSRNDPKLYHWSMDRAETKQIVFEYHRDGMRQRSVTMDNAFCVSYKNRFVKSNDDNFPNTFYDEIVLSIKRDALSIS